MEPSEDRIIVISGGGSYGAWGAGICSWLHASFGYRYKVAIGTSTGSLMAPLILQDRYSELQSAYTNLNQSDIFNVNPFKADGSIRVLNALWRFIFFKTLGESNPLKEKIQEMFTERDYDEINKDKELIVTVANMTNLKPYYMSSKHYAYDSQAEITGGKDNNWNSIVNWIWASANEPVFMSIFETDPFDDRSLQEQKTDAGVKWTWQDGGIMQAVSLLKATEIAHERQIYNIDVIVHGTKNPTTSSFENHNIIDGLLRTIKILSRFVKTQNVQIGVLMEELNRASSSTTPSTLRNFNLNVYYMKTEDYMMMPKENSLVFNRVIMQKLFDEGAIGNADIDKISISETELITLSKALSI